MYIKWMVYSFQPYSLYVLNLKDGLIGLKRVDYGVLQLKNIIFFTVLKYLTSRQFMLVNLLSFWVTMNTAELM